MRMVLNYYIETDPPSEKESTSPMTRPMLRQLNADVEEAGGDHVIFDMIAEGTPLGKIAQRFNVSRPMLYKWRDHSPRKESRRRYWTEAMKLRAEAHGDPNRGLGTGYLTGQRRLTEDQSGRNGRVLKRIHGPELKPGTGKSLPRACKAKAS